MALIADVINKASMAGGKPIGPELLLSLLSDTETLTLFIRHAGLSKAQGDALFRDLSASQPRRGVSATRPGSELDNALSKITPTKGGASNSYNANSRTDDTAFKTPGLDAQPSNSATGLFGRAGQFSAFSATAQDYTIAIDDLTVRGETRGGEGHRLPPGWFTPLEPQSEKIRGISNMAYVVFAGLIGIPALAFFLMFS